MRDYDVIGRFGGEEFVVLVPGADTLEACRVAERLRIKVRRLAIPAEDVPLVVDGFAWATLHRTNRIRETEVDVANAALRWYRRGGVYRAVFAPDAPTGGPV